MFKLLNESGNLPSAVAPERPEGRVPARSYYDADEVGQHTVGRDPPPTTGLTTKRAPYLASHGSGVGDGARGAVQGGIA